MRLSLRARSLSFVFVGLLAVTAGCGGGGGGDSGPSPSHSLGGTVAGLTGSGLVLHSSAGDDLAVTASGAFTFPTAVVEGTAYAVTVKTQPSGQTCSVANGSGTMGTTAVTNVAVTCTSTTIRYSVGGTVAGLVGGGLVLQNNAGDDLTVSASGPFTFATSLASGDTYEVTIKTQPTGESCTISNATGTIGSADVSDVAVTCEAPIQSYTVGGSVTGLSGGSVVLQNNGGDDVTVATNGAFTFPTAVQSGHAYAVTVKSKPATQTCVVTNGAGTMGDANVADVAVACANIPPNTFAVGGTVSGLESGKSVVLRNAGVDTTVSANGAYTLSAQVASGATYAVTVQTQPENQNCTIANASGTVGGAAVTNVNVTCTIVSNAIQAWTAPTSWGAKWSSTDTMVQHAWFDGTTIVEDKGLTWTAQGGAIDQKELKAFPGASRFGAGPFTAQRFEAANDAAVEALTGDMLVCVILKPDYNPVIDDNTEPVIIANGIDGQSGWVLMQRHHVFNFRYRYIDADSNARTRMGYTPDYFADESLKDNGPLNPSYMVVCAGRDGDTLRASINSFPDAAEFTETITNPGAPLYVGATQHPLTIGGYDTGDAAHGYGGRIYETAVWNEPATPANIQAKFRQVLGLGSGEQYTRNREGPFVGPDGAYHTAWRHAPRAYLPDNSGNYGGFLFGLQGWNRLTVPLLNPPDVQSQRNPVIALGENLAHDLWTKSGGATTVARQMVPPGDSEQPGAAKVTLPAGAAVSTTMGTFETPGPIHGMIWIRPVSASGTLRVGTTQAQGGGTSQHDIDLASLTANQWNRVWLTGLTTDGSATAGTVSLSNPGSSPIEFYGWGFDLTQIGNGGDLGAFDPGLAMYDWGGAYGNGSNTVDVLQLPTVPASTATTGFCLSVEAQPPAGLAWDAPFQADRSPLTWKSNSTADVVNLFVGGIGNTSSLTRRNVCMYVSTLGTSICWTPTTWTAGSKHTITGCAAADGTQLTLYADGAQVATKVTSGTIPDLNTGHVLVGASHTTATPGKGSWQGFVTKALVCPAGNVAACR